MRSLSNILTLGLAAFAAAEELPRISGCNGDKCLGALKNAAQRPSAFEHCISFTSALLAAHPETETATATTTLVVATVEPDFSKFKRRDFDRLEGRDVALPDYAGAKCTGAVTARYLSACSCYFRSMSRAGSTTFEPKTLTVTSTSWATQSATATAIPDTAPPFKMSFKDEKTNKNLYLAKAATGDPLEAFFTEEPTDAVELKVQGGKLVAADDDRVLACPKDTTSTSFFCYFWVAEDLVDFTPEQEPMTCARVGTSELTCGTPSNPLPIWAVLHNGDGAKHRRRRILRRATTPSMDITLLGALESAEQLEEYILANPGLEAGGATFVNPILANPPSTTTTASQSTTPSTSTESTTEPTSSTTEPTSSTTEPTSSTTEPTSSTTEPSSTTDSTSSTATETESTTTTETEPEPTTTTETSSTPTETGSTTTTETDTEAEPTTTTETTSPTPSAESTTTTETETESSTSTTSTETSTSSTISE
ncbi:hypothetical protein TWF481_004497 [Arthrobotrys musiformis]|uniref:Uncharacterized protein n=1 Tax=Arthrobotrys musiformis TaxID=47236 RepID=A0AAV9WLA8_9PEZI